MSITTLYHAQTHTGPLMRKYTAFHNNPGTASFPENRNPHYHTNIFCCMHHTTSLIKESEKKVHMLFCCPPHLILLCMYHS